MGDSIETALSVEGDSGTCVADDSAAMTNVDATPVTHARGSSHSPSRHIA
jgi:hypothetical protein